jgi:cell division septal protein FtsQ
LSAPRENRCDAGFSLGTGQPRRRHRAWLLLATGCFALGLVFTIAYVYPINSVLFNQAGGGGSASEIRSMAERWVFADRFRFVVGLVGLFAVLQAFRLPMRPSADVSDAGPSLAWRGLVRLLREGRQNELLG